MAAALIAAMTTNVVRQLVASPRTVPAGSPSESAAGVPASAIAIAVPCDPSGTSRAATPPMFAQTSPAATPVTNRATRMIVKLSLSATVRLPATKTASEPRSRVRRPTFRRTAFNGTTVRAVARA